MKRHRKNRGFTLVELMVTIASAAIVILTLWLFLFMTFREWNADNICVQLRRDAELAVQLMAQDVRESSTNDISFGSSSITFATNAVRSVEHTYSQTGDRLEGPPFGVIISKGVQSFDPQPAGDNSVLLTLVLSDADSKITVTDETLITVRN
jgi:prepilin-type N-terminal cleavage/methylation domain-containing protein